MHVTIGRVEVRAVLPAPPPERPAPRRAPALTLDDYLGTERTAVSNALAIAAVTAPSCATCSTTASSTRASATSRSARWRRTGSRPTTATSPQLNLFLYQVTPNQGWRNVGPAVRRRRRASRLTNPPLALDLHYLLTAYGAADFEAEILLGYGMQVLHEHPVLDRQAIRDSFARAARHGRRSCRRRCRR